MIVLSGANLTLHKKNLGGGLEPLSPIASAATGFASSHFGMQTQTVRRSKSKKFQQNKTEGGAYYAYCTLEVGRYRHCRYRYDIDISDVMLAISLSFNVALFGLLINVIIAIKVFSDANAISYFRFQQVEMQRGVTTYHIIIRYSILLI